MRIVRARRNNKADAARQGIHIRIDGRLDDDLDTLEDAAKQADRSMFHKIWCHGSKRAFEQLMHAWNEREFEPVDEEPEALGSFGPLRLLVSNGPVPSGHIFSNPWHDERMGP